VECQLRAVTEHRGDKRVEHLQMGLPRFCRERVNALARRHDTLAVSSRFLDFLEQQAGLQKTRPWRTQGEKRVGRSGERHEQNPVVERADAIHLQTQAEQLLEPVEQCHVIRLQRRVEG